MDQTSGGAGYEAEGLLSPEMRITNEAIVEKTLMILPLQIPIPFPVSSTGQALTSPLKGEEQNGFPPLQGEGKGGGGVNQTSIQLWTD
jgi:hypothetical protein